MKMKRRRRDRCVPDRVIETKSIETNRDSRRRMNQRTEERRIGMSGRMFSILNGKKFDFCYEQEENGRKEWDEERRMNKRGMEGKHGMKKEGMK